MRGGLGERGFTALAGERFVVGAGWVEPPLQLEVSAPVEGHRYGGVVVTFFAKIVSEAVRVFFDASVPKAAMNAVYDRDGAVVNPPLEFVMPGELVRSDGVGGAFDWVVEDQDQAPAVVGWPSSMVRCGRGSGRDATSRCCCGPRPLRPTGDPVTLVRSRCWRCCRIDRISPAPLWPRLGARPAAMTPPSVSTPSMLFCVCTSPTTPGDTARGAPGSRLSPACPGLLSMRS